MRLFLLTLGVLCLNISTITAQGCCSGGGGNPIAGGAATGVLQSKQMEIGLNYQFSQTNKTLTHGRDTALLDDLSTGYLFFRVDYGLSKRLTMSVATGYWLDKTFMKESGVDENNEIDMDTTTSSGIGDLILFPRYNVFNKTSGSKSFELALGLGTKIPLGTTDDSTLMWKSTFEGFDDVYAPKPQSVQLSSGAQDFMFYAFVFRGNSAKKIRFFANALYIKKGWNKLGLKFGDLASVSLFAGKTFFGKLGITGQVRGEWMDKMTVADGVEEIIYGVELESTGSEKLFFVPQISYNFNNFIVYAASDIPLYQHLEGTQITSQLQFTAGISYRFFPSKKSINPEFPLPIPEGITH